MNDSERFEIDSTNYLNNTFSTSRTNFQHMGGHDSTVPDIAVNIDGKLAFFVEAKMSLAQCGQFVLKPNPISQTFDFSAKSDQNIYCDQIIDHMNQNYNLFINAGTRGVSINLDSSIFSGWVKSYYQKKLVKYIITYSDQYILLPLDKFDEYFDITATYRCKRSGSSHPSKSNMYEIQKMLSDNNITYNITHSSKYTYVHTATNLTDKYMSGTDYEYLFRFEAPDKYLVKRLSNTFNSNVIFSIRLKHRQNPSDLLLFQNSIV